MHQTLLNALANHPQNIRIAIVGTGWLGAGLLKQLRSIPKVKAVLLIDREIGKARTAYINNGINPQDIHLVKCGEVPRGDHCISTDLATLERVENLDLIFEATGDVEIGARSALVAFERGYHFVTGACELDSIIGLELARRAKNAGVVYSNADGDQPVVLKRMLDEVTTWGFSPKVVGNCKGFLDVSQTPDGARPYVPSHQDLRKVVAMADGSKQSEEMACIGNACGFFPSRRGMHGPKVSKPTIVETFDELLDLSSIEVTVMDFVQGINGIDEGGGVFIVARSEDPGTRADMKYLKKGNGPNYLFFRDHHLCYFEIVQTILQVTLFNLPAFQARGRYVDVIAVAKSNISVGTHLDGVGGFDYYGEIERADVVADQGFLPYGLAEFATVTKPLAANQPIPLDSVVIEENLVTQLRKNLETLPLGEVVLP